jgi:hypothetical protein
VESATGRYGRNPQSAKLTTKIGVEPIFRLDDGVEPIFRLDDGQECGSTPFILLIGRLIRPAISVINVGKMLKRK